MKIKGHKKKQSFSVPLWILACFILPFQAYSQSDAKMDSLAASLEPLAKNSPKEQIYLQTNPGYYG